MFEGIKITWYGWMAIGFLTGVYLHFSYARHAIHWLLIQVLRGVIWLLHKTDPLYREPKRITPKPDKTTTISPIKDYKKQGLEVTPDELMEYLKNPDISVIKR